MINQNEHVFGISYVFVLDFYQSRMKFMSIKIQQSNTKRKYSLFINIVFVDDRMIRFVHNEHSSTNEPRTHHIAYCVVIFNEFIKELAAITCEHSTQQDNNEQIFHDCISIMNN
jgi:hypothetical protein